MHFIPGDITYNYYDVPKDKNVFCCSPFQQQSELFTTHSPPKKHGSWIFWTIVHQREPEDSISL